MKSAGYACRRYSARAAAASALLDELKSWDQSLCSLHQLHNSREMEALKAAERVVLEHIHKSQDALQPKGTSPYLFVSYVLYIFYVFIFSVKSNFLPREQALRGFEEGRVVSSILRCS